MTRLWKTCVLLTFLVLEYASGRHCTWEGVSEDQQSAFRPVGGNTYNVTCTNILEIDWSDYYDDYFNMIVEVKQPHGNVLIQTDLDSRSRSILKTLVIREGNYASDEKIPNDVFKLRLIKELKMHTNIIPKVDLSRFGKISSLEKLYLTNNQIHILTVTDRTLRNTGIYAIDVSNNRITNLPDNILTAFEGLKYLNVSHNYITKLAYEITHQKNCLLVELDISHNDIEYVPALSFSKCHSLLYLNLSHNKIDVIKISTFQGAKSLLSLDLSYNNLKTIGNSAAMLLTLENLSLTHNNIFTLKEENFMTLTNLKRLNISFNNIGSIESDTFLNLVSLEVLDLGYNKIEQLDSFYMDSSNLPNVKEMYLNDNRIKDVSETDILKFSSLEKLSIANNNIVKFDSNAFRHLKSLTDINLSSNTKMRIEGNIFQSFQKLNKISLQNVTWNASFNNVNISIDTLELVFCGITDIKNMSLFSIKNLKTLNFSMNNISLINVDSFEHVTSLVTLDLSLNKISFIQPGSFLYLEKLKVLNLNNNQLTKLLFGTFTGLHAITYVDLSRNVLHEFDINLLPKIEHIDLDNNKIANIDFKRLLQGNYNISQMSIGGNQISCNVLAELKVSNDSEKFNRTVTAKSLDYSTENVNGISCVVTAPISSDTSYNNISTILNLLKVTVDEIKTISTNNNNLLKRIESIVKIDENGQVIGNHI